MGELGQFFVTQYQRICSAVRSLRSRYELSKPYIKNYIVERKNFYRESIHYNAYYAIRHQVRRIYNLRKQYSNTIASRYAIGLSIALAIATVFSVSYYIAASSIHSDNLNDIRQEVQAYRDALDNIYKIRAQEQEMLLEKAAKLESQLVLIASLQQSLKKKYKIKGEELSLNNKKGVGGAEPGFSADQVETPAPMFSQIEKRLEERMHITKIKLEMMLRALADRDLQNNRKPAGFPTQRRWISSDYGYRSNPFGSGKREFHRGIDIPGKEGQAVRAIASGIVEYAGHHIHYGNVVKVNHADGYSTLYAHNQHILVAEGDMVEKGKTIALLGNTGRSTGPHLHFEVMRNGKRVNPAPFLFKPQRRR